MKDTDITSSTQVALGRQVPLTCCEIYWMPAVEMLTAMPGDSLRTLEASRRAANAAASKHGRSMREKNPAVVVNGRITGGLSALTGKIADDLCHLRTS